MALSFIGKPISLISHSDVRYRGILAGIDPAASTIQLSNVYSMGTELRRPQAEFIPPVQEPYQYIIFRASEVKDLAVDEPTPQRSVHDDPAVLGASSPSTQPPIQNTNTFGPYPSTSEAQPKPTAPPPSRHPSHEVPRPNVPRAGAPANDAEPHERRSNSVNTAAASMETVERALGDLRATSNTSGGRGGGGRRGQGRHHETKEIKVPTTDFDFQGSNAKFDKAAAAPKKTGKDVNDEESNTSDAEGQEKEKEKKAYNPQSSFFDSLSSSTQGVQPARGGGVGGGRRGGGGAGGRNRREEERERNVATFGEPGGVGLMGPGAYVGGWGGYGRRGGRPRRGGAAVGAR